jgi:non-ribosomal peptide synthetase-like protein
LYASLFTPIWLRLLGARIGKDVEASTVSVLPKLTTVGDGAFLADDTMIGSYELHGGWLRIDEARIGERAFLGNSGMTAPGRKVPKNGLVAVLSAAPKKAKRGSSYLGMPPMKLQRAAADADSARTYAPPRRLKVARGLVEACRVAPVMAAVALGVLAGFALQAVVLGAGYGAALVVSGALLFLAGAVACGLASAAKWALVGKFTVSERPLWSSFVWRTELADTFVECLAVPWLFDVIAGSPLANAWLRSMGAKIGKGAWIDSYWFPEADLITVGTGASVNRGCVLQTHLFHDRIMSMDTVKLGEGATLGAHGIVLPGASIGARTTIGPASLVLRGDEVPADSRWLGNPIAIWPKGKSNG